MKRSVLIVCLLCLSACAGQPSESRLYLLRAPSTLDRRGPQSPLGRTGIRGDTEFSAPGDIRRARHRPPPCTPGAGRNANQHPHRPDARNPRRQGVAGRLLVVERRRQTREGFQVRPDTGAAARWLRSSGRGAGRTAGSAGRANRQSTQGHGDTARCVTGVAE